MADSDSLLIMKKVIILGTGGHAESIADSIMSGDDFELSGFVAKNAEEAEFEYNGVGVIGCDQDLRHIFDEGIKCAAVGIGYLGRGSVRHSIYKMLVDIGYTLPPIVDKTATVASTAAINEGSFIGKRAVVNAKAQIDRMCIINSGAIVEHDCVIGEFSHVACGAVLCGGVKVGKSSLIGAGATVIENIVIPEQTIVPAGEVVNRRMEKNVFATKKQRPCLKNWALGQSGGGVERIPNIHQSRGLLCA